MREELNFNEWESSIGKLILSYAQVEFELMRLYKIWIPDREYKDETYEERFKKAIGVAKDRLGSEHSTIEYLIKMKRFLPFRHLVAHNPIPYSNQDDDWYIFDLKNQKSKINLNELIKISNDLFFVSLRLCKELRINVR